MDEELLDFTGGNEEDSLEEPEVRPEKAYIVVLESCVIKDSGVTFQNNDKIVAQLNPSEYSVGTTVNFKPESTGIDQSSGTFGSHMEESRPVLTVKLIFDDELKKQNSGALSKIKSVLAAKKSGGVDAMLGKLDAMLDTVESKYLRKLQALTQKTVQDNRPPQVAFVYGSQYFKGFVSNLDIQYKEFSASGEVTRAEATVKITYAPDYLTGSPISAITATPAAQLIPSGAGASDNSPLPDLDAFDRKEET